MRLKRCPFCIDSTLSTAEIPVVVVAPRGRRTRRKDFAITCDNCDTLGPPASTLIDAATLWNYRPRTAK